MRRFISAALLSGVMTVLGLSVLAQTSPSTPAPTGPADCSTTEVWDATAKTCKTEVARSAVYPDITYPPQTSGPAISRGSPSSLVTGSRHHGSRGQAAGAIPKVCAMLRGPRKRKQSKST